MIYEFPTGLLRLQRQFYDLDRRCQELAAALPPATRIIAADPTGVPGDDAGGGVGGAEPLTDAERAAYQDGRAAYEKAKAERLEIVMELNGHPWWEGKASEQDEEGDSDAPQVPTGPPLNVRCRRPPEAPPDNRPATPGNRRPGGNETARREGARRAVSPDFPSSAPFGA